RDRSGQQGNRRRRPGEGARQRQVQQAAAAHQGGGRQGFVRRVQRLRPLHWHELGGLQRSASRILGVFLSALVHLGRDQGEIRGTNHRGTENTEENNTEKS